MGVEAEDAGEKWPLVEGVRGGLGGLRINDASPEPAVACSTAPRAMDADSIKTGLDDSRLCCHGTTNAEGSEFAEVDSVLSVLFGFTPLA